MALWEAQIRVVPTGPLMHVEVEAGSVGTAQQTINHIYDPVQTINLKQVNKRFDTNSSNDSSGGAWIVGLIAVGAMFLYLTPYILSIVYGAGATWASQKIVGQTISEYSDNENSSDDDHKKAAIVFGSALLFGLIGFVHGTFLHQDLKTKYIDVRPTTEIHRAQ